ncbi:LuxR C-terminal-related transcriptional regulator [Carboxylicivirga sp. M1479]|uniref:LuxR C-terminal-related transcriptional regulator n=1 Tax=Carboxylicivirga sp. M1479 TaxID=2594476 RepID=UPI001177921B|nr:LuxR C-terminal-related transcriptional regulator [Carboxylicivirga sp. M1479]TRX72075.1 regulator [Carboxylicivirga sp. M1479]
MRNYLLFWFVLICLSSISIVDVYAQKLGIPEIEYFNRRQYGAATQNWKISQSESDLMYFANNDGLVEYDGSQWLSHREMGTGVVRSVKCIGERIYIGTHNDFGYFEYDSLHQFSYSSLVSTDEVKDLGDVWTVHEWGDLVVIHTEAALVLLKDDKVIKTIPSISRFTTCFLVNEMLLVDDEQEGLMEVRGKDVYPISGGDFFAEKNVTSIISLSNRELLISTMNDGCFVWDLNQVKPWREDVNQLLKKANVFCGARYNDDLLLFGTIQNGLIVVDNNGHLVMAIDKDKGLVNNTVLSVFVDKEGGVWCGLDNGIARVSLNSNVSFLTGYYNLGTGYVQERYRNDWYFGTNQALFKIDDEGFNNPLKDRDDFTRVKGTDGQVWSLFQAGGQLLCGHNNGVYAVDGDEGKLITPSSVNGVWNFLPVVGEENFLISGTYNGLILFENINGKWVFKQHIDGFNESSRFMQWDEQGRLWVSHGYKGIFCLDFSQDYSRVDQVHTYAMSDFSGSSSLTVSKFHKRMVIVGSAGLFTVGADGDIEPYEALDHFFSTRVFPSTIQEDQYKNLWLLYTDFVEVLRYLEDGTYKKITLPFIPLERKLVTSFESVFVYDRENVFFGIEDGFAHYVMKDYYNFRIPFKVHLRSFTGRSDSVPYVFHQTSNDDNPQLEVPSYTFRNNLFEFEYAAAFYGDKEMEYSTHMSSVDEKYSEWSRAASRQFTKLREGTYDFTVKARNRYGVQSKPLVFSFEVLPPWHRHMYAKIAYLVLILLIAGVVSYTFNRRIEVSKQKEKLKARKHFQEKEEQLTNDALRAEKEVIKMRNDKLRSEMKFKEQELAGLTVHIIQKNDLLSELQSQLKRIKRIKSPDESDRKIDNLVRKIGKDIDNESNWQMFESQFEKVHLTFLNRLVEEHNDLNDRDKKLCAYIRMGMASKEIASLMNISTRSVENNRYKLRQKLGLLQGDDLSKYIGEI